MSEVTKSNIVVNSKDYLEILEKLQYDDEVIMGKKQDFINHFRSNVIEIAQVLGTMDEIFSNIKGLKEDATYPFIPIKFRNALENIEKFQKIFETKIIGDRNTFLKHIVDVYKQYDSLEEGIKKKYQISGERLKNLYNDVVIPEEKVEVVKFKSQIPFMQEDLDKMANFLTQYMELKELQQLNPSEHYVNQMGKLKKVLGLIDNQELVKKHFENITGEIY